MVRRFRIYNCRLFSSEKLRQNLHECRHWVLIKNKKRGAGEIRTHDRRVSPNRCHLTAFEGSLRAHISAPTALHRPAPSGRSQQTRCSSFIRWSPSPFLARPQPHVIGLSLSIPLIKDIFGGKFVVT